MADKWSGDVSVASPSGRTTVNVSMTRDGAFRVTANRDGRRVHDFSDNYEQGGPDSEPRDKSS